MAPSLGSHEREAGARRAVLPPFTSDRTNAHMYGVSYVTYRMVRFRNPKAKRFRNNPNILQNIARRATRFYYGACRSRATPHRRHM